MSKVFTITEGLENMGALRTGGQGSVYKARRMGPVVTAVKLIPTPIYTESADDKNYLIFQNEVAKLQKVNEQPNPNVVKILSSGITDSGSLPYIEMEYIEGPDLEELLKPPHEAIFTINETVKVAGQLACALSHCHKVGVRHGDIKSNNVKYNIHSGNYVLLDFGLAVMSDEQRRSSMRHAGAIEFMAPEQNEGQMLLQTDIYSYGVVLYELLAGQVPFPLNDNGETSRNAVMVQHMEATVPDLLTIRRNNLPDSWTEDKKNREMLVPQWLLDLIAKCLQKKPEDRFYDGLVLHEAIALHSISGSTNAELIAENERLKAKVGVLEQASQIAVQNSNAVPPVYPVDPNVNSKKGFTVSKYAIIGSVLTGILLFIVAVSTMLSSQSKEKHIVALHDSLKAAQLKVVKTPPTIKVTPTHTTPAPNLAARNKAATKTTQDVIKDALKQDSIKTAAKKKATETKPVVHRRKKKKFLGIFKI